MSEQLVFSCSIYDTCKQQDCLTPECYHKSPKDKIISPARNGTGFEVEIVDEQIQEHYHVLADEVYYITDDYYYVDIVPGTFETIITVNSIKENRNMKGYYDLVIQYRFNFAIELFDQYHQPKIVYLNSIPVYQVQAYTLYTKNVTLFGGDVKSTVVTLSSLSGQCCSSLPEYNIQATAQPLETKLVKIPLLTCNPDVDQSKNNADEDGGYVVSVTIGLFTIITLFRQTRGNVVTGSPVEIPTCHHSFDPCEDFGGQLFPYDVFNAERSNY